MILLIQTGWRKTVEVLEYEATENDGDEDRLTLIRIMRRLGSSQEVNPAGWTSQTARLFAMDAAMSVIRRDAAVLSEADRHNLTSYLQEARSLVVADRDDELGFLQAAMEARLSLITPGKHRQVWLTAIDSLIPSPYRAALVSTENAISLVDTRTLAYLSDLLRDRMVGGSNSGSRHVGSTVQFQITA